MACGCVPEIPAMLRSGKNIPPLKVERRAPAVSDQQRFEHFLKMAGLGQDFIDCNLCMSMSRLFLLKECSDADRPQTEQFIHDCFRDAHGANITHFMPRLFELQTQRGELVAAFGVRCAGDEPLFLESYLDQPVEQALERELKTPLQREKIVEVGNLAAIYPGAARWLIVALTIKLYQSGFEWVVFTGTKELRNGFRRLGLHPVMLGPADIGRLPEAERANWGSYYDNNPAVMAGNIRYGFCEMKHLHQLPGGNSGITQ